MKMVTIITIMTITINAKQHRQGRGWGWGDNYDDNTSDSRNDMVPDRTKLTM